MIAHRPHPLPKRLVRAAGLARRIPLRRLSSGAPRTGQTARHRPIALHWRRPRLGLTTLDAPTPCASLALALHWSFHFAPEHGRSERNRELPRPPAQALHSAWRVPPPASGSAGQRRPPVRPRQTATMTARTSSPSLHGTATARRAAAIRGTEPRQARPHRHAFVASDAIVVTAAERGALPLVHRRRASAAPGAAPDAASRPLAAAAPTRVELVWRKQLKATTGSAVPVVAAAGQFPLAAAAAHDAHRGAARVTAERTAGTARAAAALDAGLAERLADDVIRRVERHVRIERERRGLR